MKKINRYSTKTVLWLGVLALAMLAGSCKKNEGYNTEPVSNDKTKPGVITNIKVDNFNGGANITYDLPNSDNILYVLAKYNINDKTARETKSSYYTDTVKVDGFAAVKDYEVTLTVVSRANVSSDPVKVTVHPQTPFYRLIKPTVTITNDFGGVHIEAMNPNRKEVGVILIALDKTTKQLEVADQHYTNTDTIAYSVRGFESEPTQFGVYVTDKFGNLSDTTVVTLTPLFETMLDKSKFSVYRQPSDSEIGYGWNLPYLWDGKTDGYSNGWHTQPGTGKPMQGTFGIGVLTQLSRIKIWERPLEYAFFHGNPKNFTIWGSAKESPADVVLPQSAPGGTVVGDWVNLSNFRYPNPPSGLTPGFTNAADEKFVAAGVDFVFPATAPPVKYLRILVHDTWGKGDVTHLMEVSVYGKPQ
ncbi:DUF5000 domain-containing lipoprotein [Mucilaginibacter pedocola]|uniref:DUF4959 domain-containing protein n=1 Tax=Mucilaginibacter pedocola TaxID=1792845 RepID=A0A1S9PDT5_9SPHI|nr:DUF5000 domain-containing lipoprotein [Mucilaginibacter pedocola]OOQ59057.1 hypothetical protein BC343_29520 [Mucilaginibacter pedocola]